MAEPNLAPYEPHDLLRLAASHEEENFDSQLTKMAERDETHGYIILLTKAVDSVESTTLHYASLKPSKSKIGQPTFDTSKTQE